MYRIYDLTVFDEGATGGAQAGQQGAPAGGSQEPAKAAQPSGGYSYAQAEEIASARAQKAERAALASYFKQQGLDENQITEAIAAYKAAQKAKEPDVDAITRERDEARAKVEAYEQRGTLDKKGVKPEFSEFAAYKIRELMKSDKTLDTFDKAADKFLKDNPQYTKVGKPAYKAKPAAAATAEGDGKEKNHDAANAAIKALLGGGRK